jgi:peptide/nickel transport system substrate-binding protein
MKTRLPRFGKLAILFFLCFTIVVGCNQGENVTPNNPTEITSPVNNESSRVTLGTTLKPRTIDPADCYEISGLNIIYNVAESLYTYELGTTKLKPLLATEMPKISEDGLVYTIPIRQGVTFHDGTAFNAEAMKFSLQRFIENGGKPSFLLADTIDSMEVTGEYELTIKLKKPFAAFPALLAFPGASAVSPQAYTIGSGQFKPDQLIGTGPYQLTEYKSDSIRLTAFENYWGEKPLNQGVDLQIYASNSANLFNSFRTGAIQAAYQSLDPEQVKSLQQGGTEGKWQVLESPGTAISYMVLNVNQDPLKDQKVRAAIASLVDRNLINERVLQGQGEPVYSLVPTSFEAHKPVFKDRYGDANFEQAKQLLTEAGYSETNPAVVEIWYPSGSTIRELVATTLKALAEQNLGGLLIFEPNSVESATAFSNLRKGIYPTFLVDWYPDFLDADNYVQPFLSCTKGSPETGCEEGGSQTQGSFFFSEEMNQLIDQQRQEQDPAKRQEIFAQIQELLAAEVPYIPLWQTKDYAFAQNGVTGVMINPSQNLPFWTIQVKK